MNRQDLERKVLGALLCGNDPTGYGLERNHFRSEQNQDLFAAIMRAWTKYQATDPIVVGAALEQLGYTSQGENPHERLLTLLEGSAEPPNDVDGVLPDAEETMQLASQLRAMP